MPKSFFLVWLWCLILCHIRNTETQRGKKRPRPTWNTETARGKKRPRPTSARPQGCLAARHDFVKEGCACNFLGACSLDSDKELVPFKEDPGTIDTYMPDVKQFANKQSLVVNICEPGELGIIYDCENRIPLASTIVLTKKNLYERYSRGRNSFRGSENIYPNYRQRADDYKDSSSHKPCYRNRKGQIFYDQSWYQALTGKIPGVNEVCGSRRPNPLASIHRGHLIAAQYGRGDRVEDTFLYTNVVPQFGILNSGAWNQHERKLIRWAKAHCNDFPLHIVVGCLPSTFRPNQPRFFGKAGFSDYQETSNMGSDEYFAINVPSLMWTVACCGSGTNIKNTGFWAKNLPQGRLVEPSSPYWLIQYFRINTGVSFNFFPKEKGRCEDDKNYIRISS